MKTEEALDYWLEEYTDNKNLLTKLEMAKNQASQTKDNKTVMLLNERDIKTLIVGLTKTLQSNKESIIDCSHNFIQTRKNKKQCRTKTRSNTRTEKTGKHCNKHRERLCTKILSCIKYIKQSKNSILL